MEIILTNPLLKQVRESILGMWRLNPYKASENLHYTFIPTSQLHWHYLWPLLLQPCPTLTREVWLHGSFLLDLLFPRETQPNFSRDAITEKEKCIASSLKKKDLGKEVGQWGQAGTWFPLPCLVQSCSLLRTSSPGCCCAWMIYGVAVLQ